MIIVFDNGVPLLKYSHLAKKNYLSFQVYKKSRRIEYIWWLYGVLVVSALPSLDHDGISGHTVACTGAHLHAGYAKLAGNDVIS